VVRADIQEHLGIAVNPVILDKAGIPVLEHRVIVELERQVIRELVVHPDIVVRVDTQELVRVDIQDNQVILE
jgi:hypothetical protein